MIGLYKDPMGENVFSDFHAPTNEIFSAGVSGSVHLQRMSAFGTEDTLKKRIKELEHVLSTYQVANGRSILWIEMVLSTSTL